MGAERRQWRRPAFNKRQIATATQLVADYRAEGVLWDQHGPRLYPRPTLLDPNNTPTVTASGTAPASDVDPAGLTIYPMNGVDPGAGDVLAVNKTKDYRRGYNELYRMRRSGGALVAGVVAVNTTSGGNTGIDNTIEPGWDWSTSCYGGMFDFYLDGDLFFFDTTGGGITSCCTILVDGALAMPTLGAGVTAGNLPQQFYVTDPGWRYVKVKFPTTARRHIQLVFPYQTIAGCIRTRTVSTITTQPPTVKWAHIGDSFAITISDSGTSVLEYASAFMLSSRFGLSYDFINLGVGGTGLATPNKVLPGDPMPYPSGISPSFRKQLQLSTRGMDLDVFTALIGQNDYSVYNTPLFDSELKAFIADAKAMHPNALIFLASANTSPGVTLEDSQALEAKVKQACADAGVFHIPMQTLNPPFVRGTGKQSAPNGSGNTDVYTGPDNVHPTNAGHLALAELIAAGVNRGALKVLA